MQITQLLEFLKTKKAILESLEKAKAKLATCLKSSRGGLISWIKKCQRALGYIKESKEIEKIEEVKESKEIEKIEEVKEGLVAKVKKVAKGFSKVVAGFKALKAKLVGEFKKLKEKAEKAERAKYEAEMAEIKAKRAQIRKMAQIQQHVRWLINQNPQK